jgi:ribosome-binding protein aMBF1 (putative translation factor)
MSIESVITRIRAYATFKGWSRRQYAKAAAIQDTTLRNFHKPDWNPTRKTIRKLEEVIPTTFAAQKPSAPSRSAKSLTGVR